MIKCIEIYVSGVVQGIGYRAFVLRTAKKLNIKGYVKNLPDGRVKAIAVGDDKSIRAFIEELKIGPVYASVRGIDYYELSSHTDYEDFKIEY